MRISIWLAVVMLGQMGLSAAFAQPNLDKAAELRQQLQALQQQLDALENEPAETARTKKIGTTHARRRNEATTVRIYDLSDLFTVVPAYPARRAAGLMPSPDLLFDVGAGGTQPTGMGGMMGGMGGGGGFFNLKEGPKSVELSAAGPNLRQVANEQVGSRTSIDELIKAIETTIAPDSWKAAGGEGSIAKIGRSLLVSADDDTHVQIEALLDLFRQRWGTLRTVSIRADWVWLTNPQLEGLLGPAARADNGPKAYGLVDADSWGKLQKDLVDPEGELRPGYQLVITAHNGQTVSGVSGHESLSVTGLRAATVDDETGNALHSPVYVPETTPLQEGVALQITPLVNTSGKIVVLDVQSRISHSVHTGDAEEKLEARRGRLPAHRLVSRKPSTRPAAQEQHAPPPARQPVMPHDVTAALDRPMLATQQLSTTLRVPVERTMLVGGMTFNIEDDLNLADQTLYLFVTLAVQELRDDRPAQPAAKDAQPEAVDAPPEKESE